MEWNDRDSALILPVELQLRPLLYLQHSNFFYSIQSTTYDKNPVASNTMASSDASLASKATPNITPSDAVLHVHSARLIDAPSSTVWDVLIDTSTWPSWNTFVPRVTIREQPGSNPTAETPLSPVLQQGTKMTFHVHMDPSSSSEQDVPLVVATFTPPDMATRQPGRIVWTNDESASGAIPGWLLRAERVHEVEEVEVADTNGQVQTRTEVRNWEAQVGYLVYVVRWMYASTLKRNFEAWVGDLQQYVERMRQE